MAFLSIEFVLFAIAFFSLFGALRQFAPRRAARAFLVAASLLFYGWFDWRYVFLLLFVAVSHYGLALAIGRASRRRGLLAFAALAIVVLALAIFKYADLLIDLANWIGKTAGLDLALEHVRMPFPLGLSFYALSSLGYVIDCYRGKVKPTGDLLLYLSYVCLFPVLVSGPIARSSLIPQLEALAPSDRSMRWEGTKLIAYGLIKKLAVADVLASLVNEFYGRAEVEPSTALWWLVVLGYLVQLYADFSAYSDMARGLGLWMGLDLPVNFQRPLLASSIRDLWTRWHISLTSWFRDYVHYPIMTFGLRHGWRRWGLYAGILTSFVVSGLWHGPALTLLLWGFAHGVMLSLENWTHWDRRLEKRRGGRGLAVLIVALLNALALVFFRARSVDQALAIFRELFSWHLLEFSWLGRVPLDQEAPGWWVAPVLFVLLQVGFHFGIERSRPVAALRSWRWAPSLAPFGLAALVAAAFYLRLSDTQQFLYAAF